MRRTTTILAAAAFLTLPGALQAQNPQAVAGGAGVWANNCVRCHNARPSAERTDAQWLVIVNHMRARANLTRTDARLVLAFLQATNMPETPVAVPELPERSEEPEAAGEEEKKGGGEGGGWLLAALEDYLRGLSGG